MTSNVLNDLAAAMPTVLKVLTGAIAIGGTVLGIYTSWQNARHLEKQIALLKLQKEKDIQDQLISLQDEKDLIQARLDACLEGRLDDSKMRRPTG